MKRWIPLLLLLCLLSSLASARVPVVSGGDTSPGASLIITGNQDFVYKNRVLRHKNVSYYPAVWTVNHGTWAAAPFDAAVPAEYFVVDEAGGLAVAPFVWDVCDAIRRALYIGDIGEVGLLYGQYTEQVRSKDNRLGYSGIHEGIDFISHPGQVLHAILPGKVLRTGKDKDGTVAIYNEEYDMTVLYLHCRKVKVSYGEDVVAGQPLGEEGDRGSGAPYAHIEVRMGNRKSPMPYRNSTLESDIPYQFFAQALGVEPTEGREAVTQAEILRAAQEEAERLAEQERLILEAQEAAEAERLAEEERQAQELRDAQEEAARQAAELEAQRQATPTPASDEPASTPTPRPTASPQPTTTAE